MKAYTQAEIERMIEQCGGVYLGDGDIVTLDDGDSFHRTVLRSGAVYWEEYDLDAVAAEAERDQAYATAFYRSRLGI